MRAIGGTQGVYRPVEGTATYHPLSTIRFAPGRSVVGSPFIAGVIAVFLPHDDVARCIIQTIEVFPEAANRRGLPAIPSTAAVKAVGEPVTHLIAPPVIAVAATGSNEPISPPPPLTMDNPSATAKAIKPLPGLGPAFERGLRTIQMGEYCPTLSNIRIG